MTRTKKTKEQRSYERAAKAARAAERDAMGAAIGIAGGVRLSPVKEPDMKTVHLVTSKSPAVALCGTRAIYTFRKVSSPPEKLCNACHAASCGIKGAVISWGSS